jgi:thioredoxin 1
MNENIKHFTDANFDQEVIGSKDLVLVDFWAAWCMPCRFVAPVVEAVADKYQGRLKVGKLDVDSNPMTASKYGITGIPSLFLYKGGQVVDRIIGAVPQNQVEKVLSRHLNGAH